MSSISKLISLPFVSRSFEARFPMHRLLQKLLNNRDTFFSDSTLNVLRTDLSRKERLYRFLTQMKENHNKNLDASAWDDIIQKDTLYLCKGQEYEIALRAKDVIHSAYFPHFRAQMNTVPGMATRMKFTPNKTTKEMRQEKNDENFNYVLMCNKICGGAHYKMKMIVVVLDKPAYKMLLQYRIIGLNIHLAFSVNAIEKFAARERFGFGL